ncbi:Holliday junction resolvase MOC1, chloroplastic-like [Phacochoerus africanus]|uniref:Holliday junction resolvase MOC1, chloroplastic-like n=1 Tax=Phacochoerus africanus TaxID=41426 RepID=UPI001FD95565|nr:Holliday junction resolvase MOC1, chloroplastic-like [Phacochoerus africanus]
MTNPRKKDRVQGRRREKNVSVSGVQGRLKTDDTEPANRASLLLTSTALPVTYVTSHGDVGAPLVRLTPPRRGPTLAPLSARGAPAGPKSGIRGVTLPGRGERLPGTAALKVTRRRGRGGRPQDGLRALGGDSRPDPAPRLTPRNPLTFTISLGGRGAPTCEGAPRTPRQLRSRIRADRGTPTCQDPRRDAPTSAFRPASPAGDLPRRPRREQAAAATHLARQQEPFSEGERKGRLREGRGKGTVSTAANAENRDSAGAQAARRTPGATRRFGGTSRMKRPWSHNLGVHQPGLPTHAALARQQPSGRPRPRRTRLLGSAEPHTGRAALSTGSSAGLTPPSATAAAGRVQPPLGARQSDLHEAGPAAPGEWTAEHEGAARSFRQGPRLHRVARKIAGGAGEGELSPVPVRRSLLSTPSRLQLHAGGTAAATAAAAAAEASAAAAAAALARRGHVTRPAGSLGAGRRARGRKRGSNGDWEPSDAERAFKGRTRRARSRLASAYAATRACRAVAKGCEGRGTRASAHPSRSSFARRLGRPLPPPPPVRLFPPAAASDWLRGSDVRVSMTYRGRGAEGEEGVDRARRAVTPSVTAAVSARVAASPAAPDAESDDCRRRTPAPSPGAEPEPPPASAPSSPGARRAGASSLGVHRLRLAPASADP